MHQNSALTPWTNTSIVGVPGIPIYNGRSTVLANLSLAEFTSFMNNQSFSFTFDHAVGIME